ncbi:MAG: HAMP domain-containing protein [Deferribacteres bacterium]|nr:HAMP domain-containing protein [Deferribacteres bacterium]
MKMKLQAKTLWIPVAIIVVNYLIIGVLFSKLTFSNSQTTLNTELKRLIETKEELLKAGLLLMSKTRSPGDALAALEKGDDSIAKEVINQVESLGLDGVYFTELNGHAIYPRQAALPDSFTSMLGRMSMGRGEVTVMYHDGKMFGYTPVVDKGVAAGFLVFEINIPEELDGITSSVVGKHNHSAGELVSERLEKLYNEAWKNSRSFFRKMLLSIGGVMVTTLFLIGVVLSTTSRNIIRPVRQLLEAFRKQAEGDLTMEVHVKSNDEIAELTDTFNKTNYRLNVMLHKVATHSDNVTASASQLSDSSQNIAVNAQEQSAKTAHAASSIEELNSSFLSVAQNTANAADSAKKASDLAVKGGEVVKETINGMNQISMSVNESAATVETLGRNSEQIGEIIKVINDIAGQTNLLALNAAIEAARAGEQGRGFAVVADEVRKLAERTTSATNEIGDMIKGIQEETIKAVESMRNGTKEVEKGVNSANQAGEALQEIVSSVRNVTDMIQQIATAAEEQSSTGEEVAANLESVADITKQTADAVNRSSEATQNLYILARELQQMVSGFKLREDITGDAAPEQDAGNAQEGASPAEDTESAQAPAAS